VRARVDAALGVLFTGVRHVPSAGHLWHGHGIPLPDRIAPGVTVVLDAAGFPPEGPDSLGRAVVELYRRGATHIVVTGTRGHRFIGAGLGPGSVGLRVDVYGSPGDYLASGLDGAGEVRDLDTPYPGGNLLSLASGGAIYLRDPHGAVTDDQLNGGELVDLTDADAAVILPMLAENERLLGIPVARLLTVGGHERPLERVYRKVRPLASKALQPEEAWVHKQG
jgi:hypothetical protein